MGKLVELEIAEGVGVITLNRPDRLNAVSEEMRTELETAMIAAYRSDEAKIVVITGAGRAFCVGADMDNLDELAAKGAAGYPLSPPDQPAPQFRGIDAPPEYLSTYTLPMAFPKPVIAAINGPAAGIGLVLATACDIRFIAPDGLVMTAFAQRGLVAECGLAWLMPRIVGANMAADLMLSGRKLEAEEAVRIGYASPMKNDAGFLEGVLEYAREMARTTSPRATAAIKRQLQLASVQSFGEAFSDSYYDLLGALNSYDFKEGIASFREKRAPEFRGR